MKRVIVSGLFLLLSGIACMTWGRTMRDVFVQMPDSLIPLLSKDARLDCVDYIDSGMKAMVKNQFGENSSLQVLTEQYARISFSSVATWELKLLTNGQDSMVCLVKTYGTPVPESTLSFYDLKWKKIPLRRYIVMPHARDFEKPASGTTTAADLERVRLHTKNAMISATFQEPGNELLFRCRADEADPEVRKELQPLLKDSIRYVWKGGKFVRN